MVKRTLGYAGKNIRLLTDHQATINSTDGNRLQRNTNVRKYKLMPEEVYSERNRLADDGTLSKVLFYDIV